MIEILELFTLPGTYISLLTLTLMEIVLGIDNVIFISILCGRLPITEQAKARRLGLALAMVFRIILLLFISWIVGLREPLIEIGILNYSFSGRDLILLGGGLFLMVKSTMEIHAKFDVDAHDLKKGRGGTFLSVIIQIIFLDIVFSFDSVITAVGLVQHVPIMIVAVIISMVVMLVFSGAISDLVNRYPTIKMLALSFLLMIGVLLFAEGFHHEIPKGYIYFAMAFSVGVEALNIKLRARHEARQKVE
jgi:predicted tellurium resistance membrane protein TerC